MLNLNKKFIIILSLLILFVVSVFCYASTNARQKATINCPEENGYIYNSDVNRCYNSKTGISYKYQNNSYILFYKDGKFCGKNCDLDGKNCNDGVCNALDCAKKKGYTEIANNGSHGVCHNPKTGLSYYNEKFYIDEKICGEGCNLDGRNCKYGICNTLDCAKGYTEIKYIAAAGEGWKIGGAQGICHNPKTKISYDKTKLYFYNEEKICGKSCNLEGRNCSDGICNVADCARDNGYTEVKILTVFRGNNYYGYCYNPKTGLAYNQYINEVYGIQYKGLYYKDHDIYYGLCDINGKNCINEGRFFGLIKNGYTEIIKVEAPESYYYGKEIKKALYNPKTMLAFDYDGNFYYQGAWCGENCDSDGRNCEKGICNIKDCPIWHTKFKLVDKKHHFCPINKFYCILDKHNYAIIKHAVCSIW